MTATINVDFSHGQRIATVTFNRPEVHNALNEQMMRELLDVLRDLSQQEKLVAIVLTGTGKSFCAGADVAMMKAAAEHSFAENKEEAGRLYNFFMEIDYCPVPIIARVHGAALGGGLGILAVCDIVVVADNTRLAYSEVKLGIGPAAISYYTLRKIGRAWARRLFVTGERITPELAHEIGLVHTVTPPDKLDAEVENIVQELLTSAPQAIRTCKMLARDIASLDAATARELSTRTVAELRASEEGQEGLRAFLEKRKPGWLE
jgi:methylglutaconyl-CoA hydratase